MSERFKLASALLISLIAMFSCPIGVSKDIDRSGLSTTLSHARWFEVEIIRKSQPLQQNSQTCGIGKKPINYMFGVELCSSLIRRLIPSKYSKLHAAACFIPRSFSILSAKPNVHLKGPSRVPQLFGQVHWWQRDPDLSNL